MKTPQLFVQDDWKVRPNLTLNLGLRYQINHGWNEIHSNESSFDPTVNNPATNTPGAYWFATTHANGRSSMMANTYNTWQPRVGFSWARDPNTVLRGGFGLYSYTWSLDTYGENNTTYGMGAAISSAGGDNDSTNGIIPITKLDGTGTVFGTSTPLPYTQGFRHFSHRLQRPTRRLHPIPHAGPQDPAMERLRATLARHECCGRACLRG